MRESESSHSLCVCKWRILFSSRATFFYWITDKPCFFLFLISFHSQLFFSSFFPFFPLSSFSTIFQEFQPPQKIKKKSSSFFFVIIRVENGKSTWHIKLLLPQCEGRNQWEKMKRKTLTMRRICEAQTADYRDGKLSVCRKYKEEMSLLLESRRVWRKVKG